MPRTLLTGLAALAAACYLADARAQDIRLPDLHDTYLPTPPADDSLYRALGAERGLNRLVDDFMQRLLAHPRLQTFFGPIERPDQTRRQLVLQFCQVAGGPCTREANTRKLHSQFEISRSDFNALVEVLQQAMDGQGLPFAVQNRLLAQLAPMARDIITVD
jgi:hemoglobin